MASLAPPPGIDLKADQRQRVINSGIALIVLPTVFVILRFVSRFLANAGFWWDDFLVVLSLCLSWGPNIGMMISAQTEGFGRHLWALPDPEYNTGQFLKILYIYIIFYYSAVVAIKLCILSFYQRIFPVKEIKIWLYIGYGLVGSYAVATLACTTFQCQPIHGFWDRGIPSHCVSGDNILIIPGAVNAVLDGFVIILPLPLLWRLQTTSRQKGILTGIFACGGFVCIISIVRLVVLSRLDDYDVTWNYVNAAVWSAAEPSMGVIAACIPSLRPLIALTWKGTHRGLIPASGKSVTGEVQPGGNFRRLEETLLTGQQWGHEARIQGGKRRGTTEANGLSLEEMNTGIRVKNVVTVTSYSWDYKDRLY